MSVLFLDYCCPAPYDTDSEGLGGSEATVVRVAEKLSEHTPVVVAQHNRYEISRSKNVTYSPILLNYPKLAWKSIVVLKDPSIASYLRPQYPSSPMWVWLHDLLHNDMISFLKYMANTNIGVIAVSEFHRKLIVDISKIDPLLPALPKIEVIYNPIDDNLAPDNTPVNRNKLMFASAPFKGLQGTLEVFSQAKERNSEFELFVAFPSYIEMELPKIDGVHFLGNLSHADTIKHMRSSLCVFAINNVRPETFGLVFAEANAVGTPVITHPFGAAPEVLLNHEQLINTHNSHAVIEKLMEWHRGQRPVVNTSEAFRLSNVIPKWMKLLIQETRIEKRGTR